MTYSISREPLCLNTYILRVHEGEYGLDAFETRVPYVWSCAVVCKHDGQCEIKGVVHAPSKRIIQALARFFVSMGRPYVTWERDSGKILVFDVRRWAK